MTSCALTRCTDPTCSTCSVTTRFAVVPCNAFGVRCKFISGHPGDCQPTRAAEKIERAELKASKVLPDLSAPGAPAQSLAFVKRHREGAFRKQRA